MRGEHKQGNLGEDPKSPYYEKKKYPEPTVCGTCKLVYHKGRWQLNGGDVAVEAGKAHRAVCPACHRVADREPGGLVHLSGDYLADAGHRREVLNVVKNQERQAQAKRPLLRVMWIEQDQNDIEIATTNVHLAQRLGRAVHSAHAGELEIKYAPGARFARVYWKRDG